MKSLYFDCFSGASGNMILGALLDLGLDSGLLNEKLGSLDIGEFEISIEKVNRSGIAGSHVTVDFEEQKHFRHLPEIEKIISDSELSERVKSQSLAVFRRLAEAEAKVRLHLSCVVGMAFDLSSLPIAVSLDPSVTAARLDLVDFCKGTSFNQDDITLIAVKIIG